MRVYGPDAPDEMARRTVRTMISCTVCGYSFSFEKGESVAVHTGIKATVVQCPECRSIFDVDVTPQAVTIREDVTSTYDSQVEQQPTAPSGDAVKRHQPNTVSLVVLELLALGFVGGALRTSSLIPAMVLVCVAILLGLFGLYAWRRL